MRTRSPAMALMFALGCGFDSSGGGMAGSLGSSAEDTSDTSPVTTTSRPGPESTSGSDSRGEEDTTGGPVDPTNDPTNDPTSGPTSDPTTSGPTTNDPTTSVGDGSTTDDNGESTGDPFEWYTDCPCVGEGEFESCINFVSNNVPFAQVCYAAPTPPCTEDAHCPPPPDGTATPACWLDGGGRCGLDCSGGSCPDGMTCYNLGGGTERCAWPL